MPAPGVSFGKLLKFLWALPNVDFFIASMCESVLFPVFTELGNLYAPGPGPSTFFGLRWSLFLMLELNLDPNEKIGPALAYVIVYAPGPKPSFSLTSSFLPSVFLDA